MHRARVCLDADRRCHLNADIDAASWKSVAPNHRHSGFTAAEINPHHQEATRLDRRGPSDNGRTSRGALDLTVGEHHRRDAITGQVAIPT
jgi:hypothetical protein